MENKIINPRKVILLLILITFPLGQLIRFSLPDWPGVTLHPIDFLVFLFVGLSGIKLIIKKEALFKFKYFRETLIFLSIASVSLILSLFQNKFLQIIPGLFYLIRLVIYYLFYFALCNYIKKRKTPILNYLFIEGIVISLLSILQYLFIPDVRFLLGLGWDEHYYRAIGPFLDPAFTGIILVLSFILFVNFVIIDRNKLKNAWFNLGGILIFISLALTFSRLSYISLMAGIMVVALVKTKLRYLGYFFIGFILLIFLLPKPVGEGVDLFRKSSFTHRFDSYKNVITIIKDNFVTGVGFNNLRITQIKYGFLSIVDGETSHSGAGTDNSFLFVFATCGIFGFFTYLFLWLRIIKDSVRSIKTNKHSLILLSSSVALVISSLFVNSLFYSWILLWFLIVLSVFTVESEG